MKYFSIINIQYLYFTDSLKNKLIQVISNNKTSVYLINKIHFIDSKSTHINRQKYRCDSSDPSTKRIY